MRKHYDSVIIGGGVIGGSIAYEMAKRGLNVVLLEKDRIASHSSGAAAGMLAAQVEMGKETGPLFDLAIRSRALYPSLVQELRECCGLDAGLVNKGMLRIAFSEEEKAEFEEVIACQRKVGQKAEWLSGDEVRKRETRLSQEILGAMYVPDDGQLIAPELTQAYVKSAAIFGAEIREFSEVKSFIVENGRITGVRTQEEVFYADQVIMAAGAWSPQLLGQLEIELPAYPVKGECFSVTTATPLLSSTVFTHGCYLVPKRGGRLVVGATMKEHTFDQSVSFEAIRLLTERAMRILPGIKEAEWEKAWAGNRPQTVDGLPYLGRHPEWNNLIFATGHFRNGILLSAITGQVVANIVEKKDLDGIDLSAFVVQRHQYSKIGV